jgi:hypothetical protein
MTGRASAAAAATLAALLLLPAAEARAAKDLVVAEDLVTVSPPDENGEVSVTAPPGTVSVLPTASATFTVENASAKPRPQSTQGMVGRDGGFKTSLPGASGHKLRIAVAASTGKTRKFKKKVPAGPMPSLLSAQAGRRGLFSQSRDVGRGGEAPGPPPRRWAPPAEPTPEITINYRSGPRKPSSSPLDPDAELRRSGVLPPD